MTMLRKLVMVVSVLGLAACGYGFERDDARYPPSSAQAESAVSARPLAADEYRVQPGDTLYAIGFRNQLDYHDLANWNGIGMDYKIRAGQVLRLAPPADGGPLAHPLAGPQPVLAMPRPIAPGAEPTAIPTVIPSPVAVASPGPVTTPPPRETPSVLAPPPKNVPIGPVTVRWQWPATGPINRGFSPEQGSKGLDIGGEVGQPVLAVAAGKVVYSGSALKGYGELVIVKHDETYLSAYGYNRRRLVKEGDVVQPGQTIAELGVGPEQKAELHFEIRENGKPVDPMRFLPAR